MNNFFRYTLAALCGIVMAVGFCACGGDSDDDNGGSGSDTGTVSIIGTWRYYFVSNDPSRGRVYDQLTFNSDHTGTWIEEVGYGSDYPNPITWTQTGSTIRIIMDGEVMTIQLVEVIDNNTVVINNGRQNITLYRVTDASGGSGSTADNDDHTSTTEDSLPWDWTSGSNLWKPLYDSRYEPYIMYMPGWQWNEDYSYQLDGDEYSFFLPVPTDGDWQAQVMFYTDIAAYRSYAYNFYCVLESNVRHPGIKLALRDASNDDNDFFNETVPLNAHEPYIFMRENVRLPLANASQLTLYLDLSNNAATDTIKMSKVCLELAR